MFSSAVCLPTTILQIHPSYSSNNTNRLKTHKCKSYTHDKKLPCYSAQYDISANTESPLGGSRDSEIVTQLEMCYDETSSSSDASVNNFVADSSLLGRLLQSSSSVKEVKILHAIILKCMRSSTIFIENNLISVLVKLGRLDDARKVFDHMLERNVVSWTAMLNGYIRFGLDNEAMDFFGEFVRRGLQWNSKTYVCVLSMAGRSCDFELGKQVHAGIIKGGYSNLILDSSVVFFYAQCGDLEGAFRVFDVIRRPDVVCWTTMITACSQHGRGKEALLMFLQLFSDGFDANEFTVCSILNACGEERELMFGKQLHAAIIKNRFRMDVFIGTSLVDMYAKCSEIDDARTVFDGMGKRNTVTWTSIIAGYARNGHAEEAIRLFRIMKRRKIFANNLTMVSILRACGLLRALPTGKEVHGQIIKSDLQDNIYLGSALVWLYCKCSENSAAHKVLQDMPIRDVVSWTAMISGCAHVGHEYEALEYLKEMLGEGVSPNPFTYSSALKACAKLEDIERGKLIHSSISKTPALSNVFVGSALINMYAKCGHIPEAIQIFDNMPERNLVSWKAMIVAYAKNGFCGEALKLMYRMQGEGIEVDDYTLATVLTARGEFKENIKSKSKYFMSPK
ncbi:pentatricopeptide repeat-containing protein At4g18520, chloroplastic-like [Nicotiana tabacum]|uniref:Pentatricopeptide repeat-containing protein At4g18520, chloroplastic-like n=2 Tax=Nicotiana TaxID=4085 RepID=A0A1S3XS49_TOBAC|nr:PREDICTED: pentatricopeptide repeat-containing protein At4g18520 [Nicotiana sylvestris]XP_016442700.1 PREDICTED: pentatricopeptide repeat-containing protein At4g18520-like [Nicotiana tabacum]